MALDDWKKLVDVLGLVLLGFAFGLGVASWKIGNEISRRDEARATAQQERAAKAEASLLALQKAAAPRHLEPEKRTALITYLQNAAQFSDKKRARLVVNCLGPVAEPCNLADEIVSALNEGGWPVVEYNRGITMSGANSEGIAIFTRNAYSMGLMKNALSYGGVDAEIGTGDNDDVLILLVGYKKTV